MPKNRMEFTRFETVLLFFTLAINLFFSLLVTGKLLFSNDIGGFNGTIELAGSGWVWLGFFSLMIILTIWAIIKALSET
jgi:hypothetical protein